MKHAFLFPGQGAQVVGMGKDFFDAYPVARETFQETDEILQRSLSKIIFEGPAETLMQTKHSQPALYVNSIAILRVMQQEFPHIKPSLCAGLSLGEYTALTAAGKLDFAHTLPLVAFRGEVMHEACEKYKGAMAAVLGLTQSEIEQMVAELNLPDDLWAANFNTPGQTVISGTEKGVAAGSEEAKARGAKRVIPLKVHGAFHSGLMREAQEALEKKIEKVDLVSSDVELVMNVVGKAVSDPQEMKENLAAQVCAPVRWEQSVAHIAPKVQSYIEIGCGKTLCRMCTQMGVGPAIFVARVADLEKLGELS